MQVINCISIVVEVAELSQPYKRNFLPTIVRMIRVMNKMRMSFIVSAIIVFKNTKYKVIDEGFIIKKKQTAATERLYLIMNISI